MMDGCCRHVFKGLDIIYSNLRTQCTLVFCHCTLAYVMVYKDSCFENMFTEFRQHVFKPKNPMHISVSYCTLAYVMVYEDSCFQGFRWHVSHPRAQCTLVFCHCTLAYVRIVGSRTCLQGFR